MKIIENPQSIGEHLKNRRLQLKLLQSDVAKILDVCEDSITGWENGRSVPQIQYYPKLIEFLGYNPLPIETETLGGWIKKYRVENGLSYKQLSKKIGFDSATLASWEDNKTYPNTEKLNRLKEFLK